MPWDSAYLALNAMVMPAWFLLIFFPNADVTRRLVHSILYPIINGLLYTMSLIAGVFFGLNAEGVGFTNLSAAAALYDHPNGVLTGWSHYIVFDLFVGASIGRDGAKLNLPRIVIVPALLATYVFGPLGLMFYCAAKFALRREAYLCPFQLSPCAM